MLATTHEAADGGHQLGRLLVALLRGVGPEHAVSGVVVEQPERDLVESGLGGADLGQDVDAIAVVLHHALDSADLALDPAQSREELISGGAVSAGRWRHGINNTTTP